MKRMYKTIVALGLSVILTVSILAGCESTTSGGITSNQENKESTYLSWVGQFELEKIEVFGNVFVKEDFSDLHYHTNQHITLNKDGTGELAISVYTTELPLETMDIEYTYDMAHQSGYISLVGDSSEKIKFTLVDGVLTFEVLEAIWTFKK